MLIENTCAAILYLPTGVRLDPGINDVNPAAWEKARAHVVVASWIDKQVLRLPDAKPTVKAAEAVEETSVENLSGYSAHDAELLIDKTFGRDLLKKWLGTEKRGRIKKALENQLEAVKVTEG